jgi:hypothetical protein
MISFHKLDLHVFTSWQIYFGILAAAHAFLVFYGCAIVKVLALFMYVEHAVHIPVVGPPKDT